MSRTTDELYRIGTVAKLTGISVECLRAWERRYGLQPTQRTGNARFYSRQQLKRLQQIKALLDQGHPISSLVELSAEQLDARLRPPVQEGWRSRGLAQLGLVGPDLLLLEQQSPDNDQAEVTQRWVSLDDFVTSHPLERAQLDAVALQLPSLNLGDLERACDAAPDCRLIALYQFASQDALAKAQTMGVQTLAWPLAWEDLIQACATPAEGGRRPGKSAPRRYSDHELVALASRAMQRGESTPRHLVSLISNLNAFTAYATQCITEQPADAELHEHLREAVSHARAQLERALAQVAEAKALHSN